MGLSNRIVYVVMRRYEYEGLDEDGMRMFERAEDAMEYAKRKTEETGGLWELLYDTVG